MDIKRIPRHVGKRHLAGLKVGDLVQTTKTDYSQARNSFDMKTLPAQSVGRVKRIFDFGRSREHGHRFLVYCKFYKHPITNFYAEELAKVRV
jgi:hypothetical protein